MKNKLIILFLLTTSALHAQQFRGEITAGIAGSQVSGDQLGGFNKAGVIGGIGVRITLNEHFEAGFRMLYFQKGSRQRLKNDGTDTSYYLLRLNYIEIPFTIRYHATKNIYIEAGPSLGRLVSSREEDANGELTFRQPFYNYDLSITGSLGYSLTKRLDFTFAYWQSVLPVREHSSNAVYLLNRGQYNSAITFSFLYTFRKVAETEKDK